MLILTISPLSYFTELWNSTVHMPLSGWVMVITENDTAWIMQRLRNAALLQKYE